jgi:hypothetical protein
VLNQFQIGTALLAGAATGVRKLPCGEPETPVLPLILNCNPLVRGVFIESAGMPRFFNAADGPERALKEAFTDTDQEDCQ